MGLMPLGSLGLMGLVVGVVEVLGGIISNSSYGERVGNCSLESGATLTAMETSVTLRAAISATSRSRNTNTPPCATGWGR